MKPKLNLDAVADAIAHEVIDSSCQHAAERAIIQAVRKRLAKRPRRHINFDEYYRFLATHEAKFERGLKSIWAGERRQMIANMKRTPKGLFSNLKSYPTMNDGHSAWCEGSDFDTRFDQWLYPQGPAKRELEKAYKDVATKLIQQAGKREATKYDLDINWDVFNPNVDKWLKKYVPKYSGEIEGTSYDELKAKLLEGWEAGESIPDLTKRVNEIFDGWEKWRAERLARTESIRGSNQGALETYKASGVVDRVMWLATPTEKTCQECIDLDGKVVNLDDDFFDADYGDGNAPPRHPSCRCTVLPILEGEEV